MPTTALRGRSARKREDARRMRQTREFRHEPHIQFADCSTVQPAVRSSIRGTAMICLLSLPYTTWECASRSRLRRGVENAGCSMSFGQAHIAKQISLEFWGRAKERESGRILLTGRGFAFQCCLQAASIQFVGVINRE
jgi:hypothetical protein